MIMIILHIITEETVYDNLFAKDVFVSSLLLVSYCLFAEDTDTLSFWCSNLKSHQGPAYFGNQIGFFLS